MSDVNQQGITFSKNDVEIIARETLYRRFFSLDLYVMFSARNFSKSFFVRLGDISIILKSSIII